MMKLMSLAVTILLCCLMNGRIVDGQKTAAGGEDKIAGILPREGFDLWSMLGSNPRPAKPAPTVEVGPLRWYERFFKSMAAVPHRLYSLLPSYEQLRRRAPIRAAAAGLMSTAFVKLFVLFIGFGPRGARRYSMAAEMIKQCHGQIPPNSMLATYQSIGAGGLGWRRFTKIFLIGFVSYYIYYTGLVGLTWQAIKQTVKSPGRP